MSLGFGGTLVLASMIWPRVGPFYVASWIGTYGSLWLGYLLPTRVAQVIPEGLLGLMGIGAAVIFWAAIFLGPVSIVPRFRRGAT